MTTTLRLSDIRTDGGTQPRARLAEEIVDAYAEDMDEGAQFPPVVVFHDGHDYWLADGFHRIWAAKQVGLAEFAADIKQGTRRDAILYSVGANTAHGLHRTNDDKRRAVKTLLEDAEWVRWSDREIARHCNVGHPLVAQIRIRVLTGINSSENGNALTERAYTTKHGTTATMQTANIGKTHTTPDPMINEYTDERSMRYRQEAAARRGEYGTNGHDSDDDEGFIIPHGDDDQDDLAMTNRGKLYNRCFDLLEKMLDAHSKDEFNDVREELFDTATEYFNEVVAMDG